MIKTIKVMLFPNNKQKTKLFECAGTARFAYNWALAYEKKNHEDGNQFLSHYELRKIFTDLSGFLLELNVKNHRKNQQIKE